MSAGLQRRLIVLQEQRPETVWLWLEDAALLKALDFEVICIPTSDTSGANPGQDCFQVNPKQYVSHLALPSGDVLLVEPKIDPANVFRMLAYVYVGWNKEVFRKAEVLYSTDKLLFEPLVELFCDLVAARVRRGLVQDYERHEENLSVMRGRILFERQVVANAARPDRLFCRYHQRTPDNEDNQIVRWTLRYLTSMDWWSTRTVHSLRVNLRHFSEVSLRAPDRAALCCRVYNRMNDDYRLLHDLCRLFLENGAITEHSDDWRFRGFRLDMNLLFEAFVTRAFSTVSRFTRFTAHSQRPALLSQPPSAPLWIRPDVTVCEGTRTAAIVDAKYKRLEGPLGNADFYQMLAYGTVLQCSRAYLFYPATVWNDDGAIYVRYSPIKIHVRRIDIGHPECVSIVEQAAKTVLDEASVELALAGV
jgi:5-methylcytosine-specific restriction enzyme subunit McrC